MRGLFGIVASLLAVLVVALVVRQQLRAGHPPQPAAAPDAVVVPADPLRAEQQVRDGLAAAAAEAQRRNDAADAAP